MENLCRMSGGRRPPRMRGGKEEPWGVQAEGGSTECEEEAPCAVCIYVRVRCGRGPGVMTWGIGEQPDIPAAGSFGGRGPDEKCLGLGQVHSQD